MTGWNWIEENWKFPRAPARKKKQKQQMPNRRIQAGDALIGREDGTDSENERMFMLRCREYEISRKIRRRNHWNPKKIKLSRAPGRKKGRKIQNRRIPVGDALIELTEEPNENRVDIAKKIPEKSQANQKIFYQVS